MNKFMPIEIYSALLGAFIGVLFTYWFSLLINKNQERIIAVSNFRAAFAPLISQMALAQENPSIDKRAILNDTFKNISVAIELFRPYVRSCEQEAYQKAWTDYYSTGIDNKIHLFQYANKIEIDNVKKDSYKLFTERVNHLLSFAKP